VLTRKGAGGFFHDWSHAMYKNILVPLDGSKPSETALAEVLRFAGEQDARLRLLFVCESPQYILMEGPVDLTASIRRRGEAVLGAAALKTREAGLPAETAIVDAGDRRVAEVIVDEARRTGADLIALGTHGRRGVEHLMLGSVAEGVVRRATTPVLLLREGR
jgi:nucleotide-binding universal stress UspA family protein